MNFTKVKISKDEEVELTPAVDVRKHTKHSAEVTGVNPLPSFKDALSAFLAVFLRVVPQLKDSADYLRVSTLSLGEKDGDRSLQIASARSWATCATPPKSGRPGCPRVTRRSDAATRTSGCAPDSKGGGAKGSDDDAWDGYSERMG